MKKKGIRVLVTMVFALYMALGVMTPSVQASSTYEVLKAPAVSTASSGPQDLGVVKVTIADAAMCAYSTVTVSLPSDLRFPNNETASGSGIYEVSVAESAYAGITIVAPGNSGTGDALSTRSFAAESFQIHNNNNFDIKMANPNVLNPGADKYFYIYFNGIVLNNTTGDIEVSFYAPSGSGFSSAHCVIAKVFSGGSTTTNVKSVQEIPATGGQIGTITVMEDRAGSLDFSHEASSFNLEILTEGCSWTPISEQGNITYAWSFPASSNESLTEAGARAWISGENNEILNYKVNHLDNRYNPGKISFNNLKIEIDPHKAIPGQEIKVKISGYDMDKTTLVVAKYAAHRNLRGQITLENSSDHSGILVTLYDESNVIAQTTTGANGRFSFSNIPAGVYDLTASRSNWLSNKIYDITIHPGKTTVTEPIFLWFGDLNNDNTVDLFDLAKLCQNYGRSGL